MGIPGTGAGGPASVSGKALVKKELPGGRSLERGDLSWERENGGVLRRDLSGISFQSFFQRDGYRRKRDCTFL